MNYKSYFSCLIFLLLSCVTYSQPNEKYINMLLGQGDHEWLQSTIKLTPTQRLNWTTRNVQGFMDPSSLSRKQAALSQDWMFYSVDANKKISDPTQIKLPHRFEKNRNYKSGWYVTKYHFDKVAGKRLILMLDRVNLFSMVYVNGKRIGHHFGSFTPFEFDITNEIVSGDNQLAIFVYDQSAAVDGDKAYNQLGPVWLKSNYSQGRGDKELSGGIDALPILEIREKASIQDIFVKTSTRKGEMEIEYELSPNSDISSRSKFSFEVLKWPEGKKVDLELPDISITESFDGVKSFRVKWPNPELWSPDHPNLYVLRATLQNGTNKDVLETRFGFREFWIEGKTFMLNGVPTRLRGESTYRSFNYEGDSHQEIFKSYKKLFGVNACRIHAYMPPGDIMLAADEAGVLLIDQSAIWSVNVTFYKNGGDWLLKNLEQEYKEWAKRDRNCPSVVIWDVENEMLRYNYELHLPWVSQLPGFIQKYDDTRPFNFSGAGWFGVNQYMASLHMQEHYTRIMKDWKSKGTFPLIMGEFWVGGRMEQRLPTSPELESVHQRYVEEAKIYEDKLLEMRYLGVSGIMPFRFSLLAFYSDAKTSQDNKPKVQIRSDDVVQKLKHGLQPVCIYFWPRQNYGPSANSFQRELVICNDGETADRFEIAWKWENQPAKVETVELQPGSQQKISIDVNAPVKPQKLIATVHNKNGLVSTDTLLINPIRLPELAITKKIQIYKDENLAKKLSNEGFESVSKNTIPELNDNVLFIIPEHANNRELNLNKDKILAYLYNGGSVLCLKQDQAPSWLPMKFQFWSANQTSPHTYAKMGWEGLHKDLFYSKNASLLAPSHPIFAGINNSSLHLWDNYDGRVSDDVFVRPANVEKYEQGNWRPLAAGSRREHVSLAELFYGKGTLLSCQLNIIDNIDNIQARSLFINMLNYLSDKQPETLQNKISVRGTLKPAEIARLTGASEQAFIGASAKNHDLMMAFDGATISEIKDWASNGGKVIVLSDSLSQAFEGIKVSNEEKKQYLATKISDQPLLYGVSSANFLNGGNPLIKGCFVNTPPNAKVLLQGFKGSNFWKIEDAGPVMVSISYGKGEILLSTIEIEKDADASARELLDLLLTNCGVEVPTVKNSTDQIVIKKTVPITIDGKLNEWLEDMEDRNVTQYIHAQPVYLTSENIVDGAPEFDLNLSAIDYFLWNEKALYLAGVVFSEVRTYETGIGYGSEKEYTQEILFNQDIIKISVKNRVISLSVNGKTNNSLLSQTGQINSRDMTDATNLQFNYILASGEIAKVDHLIGETFELMIPWEWLTSKLSDENFRAMINLRSKGSKIQVPLSGSSASQENWLNLKMIRK